MTRRFTGRMKIAAVLFALTFTAAACSDSDSDESSDTTAESSMMSTTTQLTPVGSACSQVPTAGEGSVAGMQDDTVGTAASNNPLLTTLVQAVTQANLVDTLNAPGPYTVFAPINSAFEKVPAADLQALLNNPQQLDRVLKYHVVPQRTTIDELTDGQRLDTAAGAQLTINKSGDTIRVNDSSTVVCGNVPTANATVMLIDTVLMPPAA